LFLYDVTSSYLEGTHNEYAAFGYNRDGNTQDKTTVASQVKKISERFGGGDMTLVCDRGMIKNKQMQALGEH